VPNKVADLVGHDKAPLVRPVGIVANVNDTVSPSSQKAPLLVLHWHPPHKDVVVRGDQVDIDLLRLPNLERGH
jgi:hypothetical protein